MIRRVLLCLAGTALMLAMGGCATTDQESDLPWNMTQPWETAPALPFGTGGGY